MTIKKKDNWQVEAKKSAEARMSFKTFNITGNGLWVFKFRFLFWYGALNNSGNVVSKGESLPNEDINLRASLQSDYLY